MLLAGGLLELSVACSKSSPAPAPTLVNMHFDRATSFYDAPFPSDDLRRADGSIAIGGFPNPIQAALPTQALALIAASARGFAESGGVFFSLTSALDPTGLPDLATSTTPSANVFLVGVDAAAPDFGKRYPIDVAFQVDGGPYGAPNLLSLVPLQGIPLRPGVTYAAVVLRHLHDASGALLGVSEEMTALASGQAPSSLAASAQPAYQAAVLALTRQGVASADIAGLAVFTTDTPASGLAAAKKDALSRPLPAPLAAFTLTDTFDEFCAFESTLAMPVYQSGTPPYDSMGGEWTFDASGKPVLERTELARIFVTVPRSAMPAGGYPVTVFVRTGGGGDRPLIDRGTQAANGGPAITPGTGPALFFARAGFAGVQVDGPLGGVRNTTGGDEQFLIFNIFNGGALRDNVRQSALELVVLAHVLPTLSFDASACPGITGSVKLDTSRAALMGHSMGATIAPLVLANEPTYRAAVLSGAGASWIANILYKEDPLNVAPAVELLLHYPQLGRHLTLGDPILSIFQWAEEPADPLVYARSIVEEPAAGEPPRDVLMEQGIVDHYILPPIANAMSLSLGLDLGGTELDGNNPALSAFTPLSALLGYSGRGERPLPLSGNFAGNASRDGGSPVTAVVIQHPSDGIEDGHEVVFQTDAPKREYRCYLKSFSAGVPAVPGPGDSDAGCF